VATAGTARRPETVPVRRIAVLALLVLAAAAVTLASRDDPLTVAAPGIVAEEDLPEAVAVHYRAAETHADVFAAVPCFCGCERELAHRSLSDCFVRPDGRWESHGSGCGVCLGEAARVGELVAAGVPTAEIRRTVVAEWDDPYVEVSS